ncbi:Retrovirus-related Pol polyprotein from transposon TNT 1-94 [Cucumis melo var. makuwa]|uniref:Retrovirus-related Pol polyprotein from transposon TNT 1-94 n=1 Tax=Cucumis melo var. makuwa TaxID=1194695 RepID=A0A5A7VGS9_CUCMM|nr:Retrovirus-related Pol polyprotein from transposon TNT 1-94 [Cucumis melo var. makuwa]
MRYKSNGNIREYIMEMFNLAAEVKLQLGKKIKAVKSDRGGEYYGRYDGSSKQRPEPFTKYLEECGIVLQYTMSRKLSMNGVAERRNRTLKDMVPTKAIVKTPYESWIGKKPSIRHLHTKNAKFHEDVEFEGEDNIKKVVFEEELVSFPNVAIDDVQTPILDFTMEPFIEQDNNEVPEVQTQ